MSYPLNTSKLGITSINHPILINAILTNLLCNFDIKFFN